MRNLYFKHLAAVTIIVTVVFVSLIRMMESGLDSDFELEHYVIEIPIVLALALPLSGVTYWIHKRSGGRSRGR